MREAWTDDRLDDLNRKVDRGFERVEANVQAHRTETRSEFAALRGEMNHRFEGVESRLAAQTRTMVLSNVTIVAALIGLIATQL